MSDGLVFRQIRRELDYLELLTPCRFINGSFVQRGAPRGRAVAGFPHPDIFPADAAVLFIGRPSIHQNYRDSSGWHGWHEATIVDGIGIYRLEK